MHQTLDIVTKPEEAEQSAVWKQKCARKLGLSPSRLKEIRLRKQSIDARKAPVRFQLRVEVWIDETPSPPPTLECSYPDVSESPKRVLIVGAGPAGLFAALRLIESGVQPILLERGKDVIARRFDLAPLMRQGRVIEDSNYCFGEGGAGAYSDGKLYTRATKRGNVMDVYRTLVAHGAPERILTEAHPHVGSNLLPNMVRALRESILKAGGEVHFGTKVVGLLRSANPARLRGVVSAGGREFLADATILATGHSARDVFRLLHRENLTLEPKVFAVGVRIEHPQPLIDRIQYHLPADGERPRSLPAARYSLSTTLKNRGVFSFCMCPGGFIVPAATENDEVVVNGMSLSKRSSPFANSGMVVNVTPEDLSAYAAHGPLAGIEYQRDLETLAATVGGGRQQAPAQRLIDFLARKESSSLPKSSYKAGIQAAPLHQILPHDIAWRLETGLRKFSRSLEGYLCQEAVLLGFETRTSSPVRIPREKTTLQHPDLPGLFPCGEGAGYAGGIVSAALDGIRCADASRAAVLA
ncbi:MAG: FAD-dependent oxidoreductase [Verrucomicrobiota bacterium]